MSKAASTWAGSSARRSVIVNPGVSRRIPARVADEAPARDRITRKLVERTLANTSGVVVAGSRLSGASRRHVLPHRASWRAPKWPSSPTETRTWTLGATPVTLRIYDVG